MWGAITGLIGLGTKYVEGKQKISEAKTNAQVTALNAEATIKQANAIAANKMAETGQMQDHNLDKIAMEDMKNSWLDEIIWAILWTPVVMAFVGYEERVKAGFEALEVIPDWFMYMVVGTFIVKYGLRGMFRWLMSHIGGIKKLGINK